MDFVIDTVGDDELLDKEQLFEEVPEDIANVETDAISVIFKNLASLRDKLVASERKEQCSKLKSRNIAVDEKLDAFFDEMGWGNRIGQQTVQDKIQRTKNRFKFDDIDLETGKMKITASLVDVDKEMKKSALKPGLEKEISLPEYNVNESRLKAKRKLEREKTKGPSWFNMPAPEITQEVKNDLEALKMRSALDPKRFYKRNDAEATPKYFQIGTVQDSALDHTNLRLTKKERKKTIVDELLADAQFKKYNKSKYKQIIEEKRKTTYKTYIKDKRKKSKEALKNKKKDKSHKVQKLQRVDMKFKR